MALSDPVFIGNNLPAFDRVFSNPAGTAYYADSAGIVYVVDFENDYIPVGTMQQIADAGLSYSLVPDATKKTNSASLIIWGLAAALAIAAVYK